MNNDDKIHEIIKLWEMDSRKFNQWRRENDLKQIMNLFEKELPNFKDWMKTYNLTKNILLIPKESGEFFCGEKIKYYRDYGKTIEGYPLGFIRENKDYKDNPDFIGNYPLQDIIEFEPYLKWINNNTDLEKPFDINFTSWSEPRQKEYSTAKLLGKLDVLKLGGIIFDDNIVSSGKNLDFINLDHLKIKNNNIGFLLGDTLRFSSTRHLEFINSDVQGLTFSHCHLDDIKFSQCSIRLLSIKNSKLNNIFSNNSVIYSLLVKNSNIQNFHLESSKLFKIDYQPFHNKNTLLIQKHYNQIKNTFRESNNKEQASNFFLLEKEFERKNLLHSKNYKSKNKFLKIKYIVSLFNYLYWGYGEKPYRLILNSIGIILIFAAIYFFSSSCKLNNNVINSIYYSATTFTTLGYGDISPGDISSLKIISIIEAFIGAMSIGFIVASLFKKINN